MSRMTSNSKRCITYLYGGGIRGISACREGSKVKLDCATLGPPELTLNQTERFARKILAMCADARKEKQ